MTTSRAGAVTGRVCMMKESIFVALSIIWPGLKSVSVNEPSDAVTVLAGPSSLIALMFTPSTPAPLRTTRPVISTPGSSRTSTGRDAALIATARIVLVAKPSRLKTTS